MREVAVIGVGMTRFGKYLDKSLKDLGRVACWDAMKNAGMNPLEIQAGYMGNAAGGALTSQTMVLAQVVFREVGVVGVPMMNIENACASGSTALFQAWRDIQAGFYDTAIVAGVEKLYASDTQKTMAALAGGGDAELEMSVGVNFPAHWALRATKRMELFGTTREHFAKVTIKNHKNGCYNPRSQYQKEFTMEDVLGSRMIATPMSQLECSPIGDGAAALILCEASKARKYTDKPIIIAGCGLSTGSYQETRDITFNDIEQRAAVKAYEAAGIGPGEVSFAEVHDCFTVAEMMRVEGIGLCQHGEYDFLLDKGEVEIDGRLPINPSGGLLAKGHPVAATGVAQICELFWQMRGEAGKRQIANTKIGLAHCSGGGIAGDGAVSVVSIAKKGF
ncbi:MAG: thiolase family protein [Candidatus Accumulibacter sp.]|nr:thiolase family protein [Accumulibacter sp.]